MYSALNNKNAVVMFSVGRQDQPEKPRFVTDCCLKNLFVYQKQTPLPNIVELSELLAAHQVCSNIDLADGYVNIRVEESAEKLETVLITHGKISNVTRRLQCF